MVIRVVYQNGDQLGRKFKNSTTRFGERQIRAAQAAARTAADNMVKRGRVDMAKAGRFTSTRWQQGLQAKISYSSRTDIRIRLTHAVPYWVVFEEGRVIRGKPLLWIPLDFATDAQGKSAGDYPGPLFRVDRAGKAPLLMSDDGPKYFGKEEVTIPKKFHLRQISAEVSREMRDYFNKAMKNGK